MAQRRISEDDVRETVESPDELNDGEMGELIAVRRHLLEELRVVYNEGNQDEILVITVLRTPIVAMGKS